MQRGKKVNILTHGSVDGGFRMAGLLGLGAPELLIILVIFLLLFGGAKKIPEFASALGRATGEFKRGQRMIEKELREEMEAEKRKEEETGEEKIRKAATDLGIDTEGKSIEELKFEISKRISQGNQ